MLGVVEFLLKLTHFKVFVHLNCKKHVRISIMSVSMFKIQPRIIHRPI